MKGLIKLTDLDISSNRITEISILKELKNLKRLKISLNQIDIDISALKDLKNLTQLTLFDNAFNDISPLKDFKNITELTLSQNKLNDISFLNELKNLTWLDLSNNYITDLSPLKVLKTLETLNLKYNYITDLLPLKELWNLKELHLSNNKIRSLYYLKELKGLESLYLNNNEIIDLSPLNELKKLKELDLSKNQIKSVFALKELVNLTDLDINNNGIKDISSLNEMTSLTDLCLNRNSITDISPLKKLNRLQNLELSWNIISDISTLKALKSVKRLDLSWNHIRDISPLKKLTSLKELDLQYNQIEELPKWIVSYNLDINLDLGYPRINFYNNPLKSPPIAIVNQGSKAIKIYFESIDVEENLYETKLVIVGRGNVGKTALAKKLLDINFQLSKYETTLGIGVMNKLLPLFIKEFGVKFNYRIWDFGGQEKYDATHKFFITENSLYIYVTEARQENNYQDINFWLKTIELFAINAPVIVVMSKQDERNKDLPEANLKEKYKNIFDFKKVSCANGYEYTIEDLKKSIEEATAQKLKLIRFPSKIWKSVPAILEKLSHERDFITYDEYLEICNTIGIEEEKAKVLSKYLHDMGLIIHKQDDLLLCETVIINLDWCVDGAYKVLDNQKVYEQKGFFSESDLQYIWSEAKYKYKRQELLNLMKKYRLCFELRNKSGYIAPNLLPEDKPKDLFWNYSDNLFFEYHYSFMPSGLLSRFIVESYAFIKNEIFWKHGVEIEYGETNALIVEDYNPNKITIAIRGRHKKELLSIVRMLFAEVHKDIKALTPIEMVQCNCTLCKNSINPNYYNYSKIDELLIRRKEKILCNKSNEEVMIHSLMDGFLGKPTQIILSDDDLHDFINKLLSSIEDYIKYNEGYSFLWRDSTCTTQPKNETDIQSLFSILLQAGCEFRGIQVVREAKINNGNIDILLSYTTREDKIVRTIVEIKKAEHPDVETALGTQLTAYLDGLKSTHGIYFVLWFKNEAYNKPKYTSIQELEKAIMPNIPKGYSIKVKIIDCNKPISPSKR